MPQLKPLYAFALLFIASQAVAENWPQFRGPTGQGVSTETNVPLEWNQSTNIAWKTPIPGEAWSSPIVWGDHVFVTTATDGGKACHVLALSRQSGEVLWDRQVFTQTPRKKEGRNSYATPTPATDGEHVYACFGDGSFVALDFNGEVAWTNRDYPFYSQHGLGTALLLANGVLIMSRDGSSDGEDKGVGWQTPWDKSFVIALDASTGKEKWKTFRGQSRISHGTPIAWTNSDGRQLVVSEAGDVLQGMDLQTGKLVFTSEVRGEGKVPSVIVGQGFAFTSGGWDGKESTKAFRLGPAGELKETNLVWEQKKGMPKVPSLIYHDGSIFGVTDNGVATCLDAATGSVIWQERLGGNFSASPVLASGRLYFVSDDCETVVIAAKRSFNLLARNPLHEQVQSSPAISDGQIFIRTAGNLICVGK